MEHVSGDPAEKKTRTPFGSAFIFVTVGGLIVALVGMTIGFNMYNRKWVQKTLKADIEFVQVPETIRSGQPSRFVVRVEQDKGDKPLPNRVMSIHVSPHGKAQIISVSGSMGEHLPVLTSSARGRTDSTGKVSILVRAADAGKYTLVATDSASNREGTVNFRVSSAEAE